MKFTISRQIIAISCLLLIVGSGFSQEIIPEEKSGKMKLFILAGQSNMDGRGNMEDYEAPERDENIFVFSKKLEWSIAKEPLTDRGVSPGLSFANELRKNDPDLIIGLIPCAVGGSPINWWQSDFPSRTIYARMIKQVSLAMEEGELAGVLFFQGERDAYADSTSRPDQWAELFEQFVNDLRKDLNVPDLPVVFAQIGSVEGLAPKCAIVQDQQENVKIKNAVMIRTKDLPLQDEWHFTSPAYVEIGKRFARKYLKSFNY